MTSYVSVHEWLPGPQWFREAISSQPSLGVIEVRDCSIAFRSWGDPARPPILLLHGSAAHSRWWDHTAPFLASEYRVVAMDLSGHGDSGWRDSYSWEIWAAEVAAIARLITSDIKPVLVAHSMGGRVAMLAAADSADLGRGLILLDSRVPIGLEPEPAVPVHAAEGVRPRKTYETAEEAFAHFRLRSVPADHGLPFVLRHLAETSLEAVPDGLAWKRDVRVGGRTGRNPGPETLERVACPVAWVCAEHGRVPREFRSAYPRILGRPVPIVEVPDAHHHLMVDQPVAMITALRAVLAVWLSR
jgi:pimeloyl-ACP methyl ester carboxylesterase